METAWTSSSNAHSSSSCLGNSTGQDVFSCIAFQPVFLALMGSLLLCLAMVELTLVRYQDPVVLDLPTTA